MGKLIWIILSRFDAKTAFGYQLSAFILAVLWIAPLGNASYALADESGKEKKLNPLMKKLKRVGNVDSR